MSISRFEAIQSLVGGSLSGGGDGTNMSYDDDQTQPSNSEIDAEVIRLEKEYSDYEYARNRAGSYPSLTDVTVALAEKAEGDSTMWDTITAERLAVKEQFPKPE